MPTQFTVKPPVVTRDDILRVIRNGLIARGVANPNVLPGSDWFVLATALGNELAVVGANAIIKCDEQMPDTAIGDGLKRIGALYGLSKQVAAGSVGTVTITCSQTTTIATGTQLLDGAGLRYQVTVGGTFATGATISIAAIDTGKATNHAAGDVLRWQSSPPFCDEKVLVATGGLTNGVDTEDDEAYRTRVLAFLQVPPGSGNWEHVAAVAEASTPSVQKAFVYPAYQGGATCSVAVTAAPTATSKSRALASATLIGIVQPFIKGKLAEHVDFNITGTVDVNADVAFGLSLPEAPTANPPGPGGGWLNGTPWPTPDGVSTFRCTVTGVTSATQFTVDAATSPTAGVSQIAWLSPTEWRLYRALVTAVSGSSGAYVITLDRPFTNIASGSYIWPDCVQAQKYVDAILAAFALMGPGEKSVNASALIRAYRHPQPGASWPYSLGPAILRAITRAGDEVLSTQYLHRTDGLTTLTGTGGILTPAAPGIITDGPNIYVPRHVAFYRIP